LGWFGSKKREIKKPAVSLKGEPRKEPMMPNKREPVKSSSPGELNALLGQGSEFEGKLVFEGAVRIDGKFKGEILSDGTLMLGEHAEFEGEIKVNRAVVSGEVNGNIHAKSRLELHAPAKVTGNLVTSALVVQEGVAFDGNCQMTRPAEIKGRPEESILRSGTTAKDESGKPVSALSGMKPDEIVEKGEETNKD
jgi:cytoskeletal protein CcmA (bactofilin family)